MGLTLSMTDYQPLPGGEARVTRIRGQMEDIYLEATIRRAAEVTGGRPVLVTENGVATDDDGQRIAYLHAALAGVERCVAEGIDVRGYFHWSALDNFEWALGYEPLFGLIAVDRRTLRRVPRPSAHWLGACARSRQLQAVPGRP